MDFITALLQRKLKDKFSPTKVPGTPGIGDGLQEMQDAPQEDIVVQNTPYPEPKYKNPRGILEALFPKTFAPDTTAGNIYGIVKDAMLIQGGAKPMFRGQQQDLQRGEALQGLTSDPRRSIEQLLPIDPEMGATLWGKQQDDERQQETAAALAAANRQRVEDAIHKRAGSLIYSATKDTYAPLRKKYYDYYEAKGISPAYELPETFDEASLGAARSFTLDPEDQARMAATREYRDERLAQGDRFEGGRNRRATMSDGTRRSEGAANREVRTTEGEANRTAAMDRVQARGRGRPGKIKRVKQPDGTFKYVTE